MFPKSAGRLSIGRTSPNLPHVQRSHRGRPASEESDHKSPSPGVIKSIVLDHEVVRSCVHACMHVGVGSQDYLLATEMDGLSENHVSFWDEGEVGPGPMKLFPPLVQLTGVHQLEDEVAEDVEVREETHVRVQPQAKKKKFPTPLYPWHS